jgi:Stress responsive A/B Barrel Domain
MKRRFFFKTGGIAALAGSGLIVAGCSPKGTSLLGKTQIQHGVIFSLKHEKESAAANRFLEDGRKILTGIPVVQDFQVFSQVSPKNEYDYGFTMLFDSMDDYQTYNEHPDHVSFVEERWMKEVEKFLEIDFKVYPAGE